MLLHIELDTYEATLTGILRLDGCLLRHRRTSW